jgi:acylphosphatase
MARIAREVLVSGRVQGVAFRWYAKERADALGLDGWVLNRFDGSVAAWVEGEEAPVAEMLAWLRRGPPSAHVQGLDVAERAPRGLAGFEIRRSEHRPG